MQVMLADAHDAEALLELQKLCYQSEAAIYNDYTIPPLTQTIESMRSDLQRKLVLKAVEDHTIIGSVRAYADGPTCKIGGLFVHPDLQDRGIGKQLMRSVEAQFPEAKRFELFTGEKSLKNLALYHKLGYREFSKRVLSPLVTTVFMEKLV